MMQLAEVTIYDPTGVPLPVLTSSSNCDLNSGETSTEALDGNPFSKWRCGNEDATLNIEFDSSQVVGSYTLTTANDHPERDPTSWTLSCVDVSGTSSQVSVVDGVVPPEERKMVYGLQRMSSHPPLPPPAPPSPPTPPLPPPPPPPSPRAPCWDVTVTTVTTNYASEQSWFIDVGSKYVPSPEFDNFDTHVHSVCLEMGSHRITLLDSFSDGWSDGSKVTIVDALTGFVLLHATTLEYGPSSSSATFEVVGYYPPAPPKTPPGVTHHTTCHIEFLSIMEGDMLQIGEITLYDTDGNALLHPDTVASSGCQPVVTDGDPDWPLHAVDGDPATMWQCEFVRPGWSGTGETPKLTLEFDTSKHLGAYQFTSAAQNGNGNPTSWTMKCADKYGDETVLSSVPPMGACTDSMPIGCAPVNPMTPYDMIWLIAPPSPPGLPPTPVSPPAAPCFDYKVKTTLRDWAYEQSWAIIDDGAVVEQSVSFGGFLDDLSGEVDEADICLRPGAHTICLYDSAGDGWSEGSSLTIEQNCGGASCEAHLEGATVAPGFFDAFEECFDFISGFGSPLPPPLPPAAPDLCEDVKLTTTLGPFASEQSWEIKVIQGPTIEWEGDEFSNSIDETFACLDPGAHTICLKDSWYDGWDDGSHVTIEENCGEADCKVLLDGATISGAEECFDFHVGPTPPPPPPSPPAVPGHVFRLVDILMNRTEAQAYCVAMEDTRYGLPSHLASVQNADENAQVLELCQASDFGVQKCWLGFSSSAADNASAPWAWDDQAEVGYTNWDSYDGILGTLAEPLPLSLNSGNTAGAIMQAADLGAVRNEGKWAAEDPSSRRPFVCMERYVSPPSPSPPPPPDLPGARTFFGLRLELTVRIPPSYP